MKAEELLNDVASGASYALKSPPGVVGRIALRKKDEVRARAAQVSVSLAEAPAARDFRGALCGDGLRLIAEFKPRSPSRGQIRRGAAPADVARWYGPRADAISVLCDGPDFGGSHVLLAEIRAQVTLPVLCKDFVVTPFQLVEARAWGADAVLLMCSLLTPQSLAHALQLCDALGLSALVETHDEAEIAQALDAEAQIIGVNARDLRTLDIDLARGRDLLQSLPGHVIKVAESGIHTSADVRMVSDVADACLIGTAFMTAEAPERKIEELGWGLKHQGGVSA